MSPRSAEGIGVLSSMPVRGSCLVSPQSKIEGLLRRVVSVCGWVGLCVSVTTWRLTWALVSKMADLPTSTYIGNSAIYASVRVSTHVFVHLSVFMYIYACVRISTQVYVYVRGLFNKFPEWEPSVVPQTILPHSLQVCSSGWPSRKFQINLRNYAEDNDVTTCVPYNLSFSIILFETKKFISFM